MHDGVVSALVGLSATAAGLIVSTAGFVFGAGTEIAPWAQVGGTATAVGALAYVAKMLADGRLVAQPVADLIRRADERERALEVKTDARERALHELIESSREREDALRALLMRGGH